VKSGFEEMAIKLKTISYLKSDDFSVLLLLLSEALILIYCSSSGKRHPL